MESRVKCAVCAVVMCLVLRAGNGMEHKFRYYTDNSGLSSNTIQCLYQDDKGYVWVGTADGLDRFNSYDFTNYRSDYRRRNTLENNCIYSLCGEGFPNGDRIWVGTSDGVYIFDSKDESFVHLPILGSDGPGPYVTHVTCGRIVDKGITDANNMGAAMAPAAYDTLSAFFRDTGYKPADFDLILTGDLGELGHAIVRDFFQRDGVDMGPQFQDCGLLLYDRKHQDMHAGASGCGCSASVLNGYLLRKMREGKWKTILFAPTGALLSPTSSGQGESIPSICHAVRLSAVRE